MAVFADVLCYRKSKEEYELEQERKRAEEVSIAPLQRSYVVIKKCSDSLSWYRFKAPGTLPSKQKLCQEGLTDASF